MVDLEAIADTGLKRRSHSSPVMTRNRFGAISTAVFDRIIETRFSVATDDRLPVPRTKLVWCKNIGFQHVLVKRNQVSSTRAIAHPVEPSPLFLFSTLGKDQR